jgi:hypothetical protein
MTNSLTKLNNHRYSILRPKGSGMLNRRAYLSSLYVISVLLLIPCEKTFGQQAIDDPALHENFTLKYAVDYTD